MGFRQIIFFTLFYLAGGVFLSLGTVRQSRLGRAYFLYHGLGSVALAIFAFVVAGTASLPLAATPRFFVFLALAGAFSLAAVRSPRFSYVLFALATAAYLWTLVPLSASPVFLGNAMLATLMLGFSMAAMLLGHWYLVQPKLSIDELGRVSLILIAVIALRFVLGTAEVAHLLGGKSEEDVYLYLFAGNPGIFVLMRWVWGLLAPLALCYFIWGTVKIRSTQSATGILYVVVLSVLTGEILGQYLTLFHGIPS